MEALEKLITHFHIDAIFRAVLLISIGFFVSRLISISIDKALSHRLRPHQAMLLRRVLFYLTFIIFTATAIQHLGFNISTLLGATGILTVAIGIASQTSMSNIVSGIFIIGEKPFEIGDTIIINNLQGEVLSIGFLSLRIRTKNNTMVRIPNETLVKSPIINLPYFPVRCIDLLINVAYREDLEKVKNILLQAARDNPLCLGDPQPGVHVDNLGDFTVNIRLQAWSKTKDYDSLKSSIQAEIKNAFAKNNIETPPASWPLKIG